MIAPDYPYISGLRAELCDKVLECSEIVLDRIEANLRNGVLTEDALQGMVNNDEFWRMLKTVGVSGAIHTGVAEAEAAKAGAEAAKAGTKGAAAEARAAKAEAEAKKGARAANIEKGGHTRARFVKCAKLYDMKRSGAFLGEDKTAPQVATALLKIYAKEYPGIKPPSSRHLNNLINKERRGEGPDDALASLRSRAPTRHST